MTLSKFPPQSPGDAVDFRLLIAIAETGHLYRIASSSNRPDARADTEYYRTSFVDIGLSPWERHPEEASATLLLERFGLMVMLYETLLNDPDLRSPLPPGHIP